MAYLCKAVQGVKLRRPIIGFEKEASFEPSIASSSLNSLSVLNFNNLLLTLLVTIHFYIISLANAKCCFYSV